MLDLIKDELKTIYARDPAARNALEILGSRALNKRMINIRLQNYIKNFFVCKSELFLKSWDSRESLARRAATLSVDNYNEKEF